MVEKKKLQFQLMEVAAASTAEGKCQGETKVTVGLIITRHLFGVWVQRWDIK